MKNKASLFSATEAWLRIRIIFTLINVFVESGRDLKIQGVLKNVVFLPNHSSSKEAFAAKMKDFQGPAILVYNDAKFTEEDFAAISKLGRPSKLKKPSSIGKFGNFY